MLLDRAHLHGSISAEQVAYYCDVTYGTAVKHLDRLASSGHLAKDVQPSDIVYCPPHRESVIKGGPRT